MIKHFFFVVLLLFSNIDHIRLMAAIEVDVVVAVAAAAVLNQSSHSTYL